MGRLWRRPVVFLARHATPDWNRKDIRYDVAPGPPLVPEGEEEARTLGSYFCARPACAQSLPARLSALCARQNWPVQVAGAASARSKPASQNIAARRTTTRYSHATTTCSSRYGREAEKTGPVAIISHGGPVRVMLERLGHRQRTHLALSPPIRSPEPAAARRRLGNHPSR